MEHIIPILLGMPLEDALLIMNMEHQGIEISVLEYHPSFYKNWGKVPCYRKRVIRQRLLPCEKLELVISDFHERP